MNSPHATEWAEAQQRCRLSEEAVLMAKELGMNPRTLIQNIPTGREPRTNRFRGFVCHYGQFPKGEPECEVAGCGAQPFLRLYEDFQFDPQCVWGETTIVLFDRVAASTQSDRKAIPD